MNKFTKYILFVIVIIIGLIFVSDFLTSYSNSENIYSLNSDIPENKVGVVLGTSKYISDGRRNLFYLYRIEATRELYNSGKIEYILVSGDNSTQQYNETDSMREDLIAVGIPEEKIYGDYAGFRTLDSVVRAKEVFGQENYTIISQQFHLERALFIAKNEGIQAVGYAARDVPVSRAPRVWLRERLARVKMMADIILGVDPKFLGEAIEIG